MINKNELRLGNLLIEGMEIVSVGNIYGKEPGFDFIYKSGVRFIEFEDCKPIPITDEILLKCKGFIGSGERFEFENPNGYYAYALIYRHGVWNFFDTGEDYCIATCLYVHELQNIYYWALGKIELEVTL